MKIYESNTFIAIPPGMTIKEVLEDRHMTQKELATRMDMSEKHISKLINGEVPLTQDVAMRLERVFGVEASFWNGLEASYREQILKVEYENSIDEEINFAKPFGYAKLARLGIVPETKKAAEQVNNLQKFFEVASFYFKNKFTEEERDSGITNIVMGLSFITEGAIPFGAADPARAIPSFIVGSALTGALVGLSGIKLMAPHGGIFVIGLTNNPILYLVYVLIGAVVSGIIFGYLRKPLKK